MVLTTEEFQRLNEKLKLLQVRADLQSVNLVHCVKELREYQDTLELISGEPEMTESRARSLAKNALEKWRQSNGL